MATLNDADLKVIAEVPGQDLLHQVARQLLQSRQNQGGDIASEHPPGPVPLAQQKPICKVTSIKKNVKRYAKNVARSTFLRADLTQLLAIIENRLSNVSQREIRERLRGFDNASLAKVSHNASATRLRRIASELLDERARKVIVGKWRRATVSEVLAYSEPEADELGREPIRQKLRSYCAVALTQIAAAAIATLVREIASEVLRKNALRRIKDADHARFLAFGECEVAAVGREPILAKLETCDNAALSSISRKAAAQTLRDTASLVLQDRMGRDSRRREYGEMTSKSLWRLMHEGKADMPVAKELLAEKLRQELESLDRSELAAMCDDTEYPFHAKLAQDCLNHRSSAPSAGGLDWWREQT